MIQLIYDYIYRMIVKVKAFGICRDIVGGSEAFIDFDGNTVEELRAALMNKHPEMIKLRSLLIAVNRNYAENQQQLTSTDEVALIPPVSGG